MSFTQVNWFRFMAHFTQMSTFSVIVTSGTSPCTVWLTGCLSVFMSNNFVLLLFYLSVGLADYLSVCLCACQTDCMGNWMNVWLTSDWLSVCLSDCMFTNVFFFIWYSTEPAWLRCPLSWKLSAHCCHPWKELLRKILQLVGPLPLIHFFRSPPPPVHFF